ncbi:uncharacterized protein [Glycine max]|uniref:uncharacterized protein isoform X1 n=1 Tax=Glycine max TaxID=3847 RepID=UPI000E21B774|nr:uncharacterized protein LOC102669631 isoform X1 [Glycine max]|eukprot:XP_025983304.1 uncharacterized protein LOC102669631 isoform X1 [Glycine max]
MVWPSTTPDDVDSTILACIAFSCPNLAFLEISVSDPAVNRISRFAILLLIWKTLHLVSVYLMAPKGFGKKVLECVHHIFLSLSLNQIKGRTTITGEPY